MKVFLKQPANRMYLKDSTHWTGSYGDALDFKTTAPRWIIPECTDSPGRALFWHSPMLATIWN